MRCGKSLDKVGVAREWDWDEEMPDRVGRELGRVVLGRVRGCTEQEEGVTGEGEEVVVLRIGDGGMRVGGESEAVGEVYALRELMDGDMLAEMRQLCSEKETLVLRKGPKTVLTQLALEALRNYVRGNGT